MADGKLDAGFEEVPLGEGFEEVPLGEGFEEVPLGEGFEEVPLDNQAPNNLYDSGALDAVLSGAAQGATFGFSDELGAAKDVAVDTLTGNSLGKKWREYQKEREAANKALQEASPNAYLAGEIGGGIASAALTPELGIMKGIGLGGKAAAGAGVLSKIARTGGQAALEGAGYGAAYGAGASEHDVNDLGALGKDIASGAGMGALGGAAIGSGMEVGKQALSKASQLSQKYDFLRKLGIAKEMGAQGLNFDTSEGKNMVASLSKQLPNDITNKIMEVDGKLGEAVGNSLDSAINPNAAKAINVDPQLQSLASETFQIFNGNSLLLQTMDPKSRELITKASSNGLGNLTQLEARALKDHLYDLSSKLSGMNSDVSSIARSKGQVLGKAIDTALKDTNKEYASAAKNFADFRSGIAETILQPGLPADKRTKLLGNLKHKETELYKGANELFGMAHMPGASVVEGPRAGMAELAGNLKNLEASNPQAVQDLGGSAADVMAGWNKKADQMAVLRQSQGVEPHEGLGRTVLGQIVGSGEGVAYNLANRYGKSMEFVGQSAPVKASKKLFTASHDKLIDLASQLKKNTVSKPFGDSLEKALMNKDDVAKNAVLFKLLQIPEYRQMLNSGESNE